MAAVVFILFSFLGVRVSSFLSIDDKKPQQKSIVGFLKIASDSGSSAQQSKSETVSVLDPSVNSTREQCPESKSPLFNGETSKPLSKWRTESSCTAEPQQLTFFQKAHAKRLQKQYEPEGASGPYTVKILKCLPTDSTNSSAVILTTQKAAGKTEENQTCTWMRHSDTSETAAKADSNLSKTNTVSSATQTKTQSANTLHSFTCPVCFNQIESKNLSSFNQHLDLCLSSEVENKSTSMDGYQDIYEEKKFLGKQNEAIKDHIRYKVTDLSSGSRRPTLRNDEGPYTSSSTPHFGSDADTDFRTPFFKRVKSMNEKRSLMPQEARGDSASSSVEVTSEPLHTKVSTLTCPVCNQAQDTDDLVLFNRHVDMCLNQEVLSELREAVPPMAQSDSKVKGQCLR